MAESGGNFIQNILSRLLTSTDPAAIKKRKLKAIAKNLSKARYKFYKANSGEALPALGKFFYDIYKAISPAQTMLRNMVNNNAIQHMIIEFFMSERQKKLEELLNEDSIIAKAKQIPIKKLAPQVKEALEQFCSEFDGQKIGAIEAMYRQFSLFRDFCVYDYYFLLKKFDSSMHEGDFSSAPKFDKINADYIAEDLKDFIAVAWAIPLDTDWTLLVKMLKDARGSEPVTVNTLKKITARLASLQSSRVFEMMLQLITKDPSYTPTVNSSKSLIAEPFIDKFRSNVLDTIRGLESQEKDSKINDLVSKVFGNQPTNYLKNYTSEMSETLERKNLTSYVYSDPLNYLKGFLLEYVKKDIREYCELVLIRGQWSAAPLSQSMSNSYNDLLGASDTITEFDANLAEDGSVGIKIKTLLPRTVKENDARNIINRLANDANELAKTYIMECTQNLIVIGKTIKSLIEDEAKKKPEMIANWKELERFSERPPQEIGTDVYKKIYLFVTLIQTCLSSSED